MTNTPFQHVGSLMCTLSVAGRGRIDFPIGTIICTLHVVPNTDNTLQPDDRFLVQSQIGPILAKMRYMIVGVRFKHWMTAIPILSNNNRGFCALSAEIRQECMHIHSGPEHASVTAEDPFALYVDSSCRFQLSQTSLARVTAPVSVNYLRRINVKGFLSQASVVKLTWAYQGSIMHGSLQDG
jgi:hypothetical protein